MEKNNIIQKIKDEKIVAVIREKNLDILEKTVQAIIDGGIKLIEVTMTVPNALEMIQRLKEKYKNTDVIIGAGTVLDEKNAEDVIKVGAQFVVSPILSKEIIDKCIEYDVLCIPGIATPTEAYNAIQYGAEIVKLFPCNVYGTKFVKSIKGPFPDMQIMATGGISIDNVCEWIDCGVVSVGIGSEFSKYAIQNDYEKIKELALNFVQKIKY